MVTTKNKASLNSTISPWLKKRVVELSETEDFANISDVVSQALSEFIARYDERMERTMQGIDPKQLKMFLSSPDGEAYIRSIIRKSLAETKEKSAAIVADGTYHFDIQ